MAYDPFVADVGLDDSLRNMSAELMQANKQEGKTARRDAIGGFSRLLPSDEDATLSSAAVL